MARETNKTRVLAYLQTYGSISSLEAIRDLGNTRLSSTIFLLRSDGYDIETEYIKVATRWVNEKGETKYASVAKYTLKISENSVENKC